MKYMYACDNCYWKWEHLVLRVDVIQHRQLVCYINKSICVRFCIYAYQSTLHSKIVLHACTFIGKYLAMLYSITTLTILKICDDNSFLCTCLTNTKCNISANKKHLNVHLNIYVIFVISEGDMRIHIFFP